MNLTSPHKAIGFEIIIVGTGFSDIAMAFALKNAGIDSFVVLEKSDVFT